MPPFTWALAADLLFKYGPTAVVYGQKIYENIVAGRSQVVVTAADIAELNRLAALTSESIYEKLGIPPPPPKTPTP